MAESAEDARMKLLHDLEIQMYADMYNRMTAACSKKCISTKYRDPELTKGEAVCIDRCVVKYMDVHQKIGEKITQITMEDQAAMEKMQAALGAQQPAALGAQQQPSPLK